MFGGGLEVAFLLFIAFLLFGPKKLPEIARMLGKGMAELRRASNELKYSLEEEIRNLDRVDPQPASPREEYRPEVANPGADTVSAYGDHHSESTPDESKPRP